MAGCLPPLNVEDPDLGVSSGGNDGPVIGVGHELDGEDVLRVTGAHTRVQGEGPSLGLWVVGPNVQMRIVGSRGKKAAGFGPAVCGVSGQRNRTGRPGGLTTSTH